MIEPKYFDRVYQKYTDVPKIIYTIPGYVNQDMINTASKIAKPYSDRKIDIGYRGRELISYMGRGALEKYEIAVDFRKYAADMDLNLDIETSEEKRIYGDKWYYFLSECRGVLGVEAGVSIFDIEDVVREQFNQMIAAKPNISFDELSNKLLNQWENNIFYRTLSPRHFEAAALKICQILFEGEYSGIMKPMVHYIPLKKDFSNFNEVINLFSNKHVWTELTENAYRDLIASKNYSYQKFVQDFDNVMIKNGFKPEIPENIIAKVNDLLSIGGNYRYFLGEIKSVRNRPFVGREFLAIFVRPMLLVYRNLRKRFFVKKSSVQPWRKY